MKTLKTMTAVVTLTGTVLTAGADIGGGIVQRGGERRVTGRVYDIDFGGTGSATQVLIADGPTSSVTLVTSHAAVQTLLLAALARGVDATVEHDGRTPAATIRTVSVNIGPAQPGVINQVRSLECHYLGACTGVVDRDGKDVKVSTSDQRAIGLLATAIAHKLPVGYLTLSGHTIRRVKINVDR
jgi:hypothetical protein